MCTEDIIPLIQDNISSGLKLFVDYIMKNSGHENTLGLISDICFFVGNASSAKIEQRYRKDNNNNQSSTVIQNRKQAKKEERERQAENLMGLGSR